MATYGKTSKKRLSECHPDIQLVFNAVIRHFDHTVICGSRGKLEQDAAFNSGNSRVKFPNSKHNMDPSDGIDVAPWPIDWRDEKRFVYLAGFVLGFAAALGIKLRWGGDWDSDTEVKDNKFNDYGHFERVG